MEGEMRLLYNRRQWLKTSSLAVAGLMTGSGFVGCRGTAPAPLSDFDTDSSIRLDNNESPFGISKAAREAIESSIGQSNRYPHRHYPELEELIAGRENVTPDHIILGAGSTEVMTTLIHLSKTKGEILIADPTYFDFVYYAVKSDCPLHEVPLNADFEHNVEAMGNQVGSQTGMVYICNPNNPTGSITPEDKLLSFCDQASQRALVVVDEAYHEYVEDPAYGSMIDLVRRERNVIITRTFSKIFGLAGLRIGYGIARPGIIEEMKKLERNFAPISWLSLKASVASYQDTSFIQRVKEKNEEMKLYLYEELERLGYFYVPSHTNFVLFKVRQDALRMVKKFKERNILVRAFVFNRDHWIRVSLGNFAEMQKFVSALEEISS
jgi:histidinol-phosphate aminotransferase